MLNSYTQSLIGTLNNATMLLQQAEPVRINKPPGLIGPVTDVMGKLCDYLFVFVSGIFSSGTLGFTIILFTIVVKTILLPLSAYSAKSMAKMKVIQPELKKIQEKYKGKTDTESRQRMNTEVSELQRKNGANPLHGCLPLLMQMPIIYALFLILQKAYLYIPTIGEIYKNIAVLVLQIPDIGPKIQPIVGSIATLKQFVDEGGMKGFLWWKKYHEPASFDLAYSDNCVEVISKMGHEQWATLLAQAPADIVNQITPLIEQKAHIEYFFGINLVEAPSIFSISIIIAILSGLTTFLSTWIMNKAQGASPDPQVAMQQKTMLIAMPIMMGVMTFTLPAGIGVYWIMGNIYQLGQQHVFNKMYAVKPTPSETASIATTDTGANKKIDKKPKK